MSCEMEYSTSKSKTASYNRPVGPEVRVVVLELSDPGLLPAAPLLHRPQRQLQSVQARLGEVSGRSHVTFDSWSLEALSKLFPLFLPLSFHFTLSQCRMSLLTALLSVIVKT